MGPLVKQIRLLVTVYIVLVFQKQLTLGPTRAFIYF